MRKISLVFIAFILLVPGSSRGQEGGVPLAIRAGVQDGFVRLVFSGDALPAATVSESGKGAVRIAFARAVSVAGLDGATAGITPAVALKAEGADTVSVTVEGLERHRTLTLGNRLFVDLFTTAAPAQAAVPETPKAAEAAPEAPAKPAVPQEKPAPAGAGDGSGSLVADDGAGTAPPAAAETKAADAPPPAGAPAAPAPAGPAMPAVPVPAVEKTAAPAPVFKGNATITIGSTRGVALAAFIRSGYLWIVLSQETLSVPPLVSGPSAAALGPVDSVAIDGGSAYRIKLPAGAHVRPEGAGLVWRLYISGDKPPLRGVEPERTFNNTAEGPQVRVPLSHAVNVLRLPDPVMGDDLAVVTVGRAESRLLNSDVYVDFDILPALVGAVIRPKADGMRVAVTPRDVTVGRQGGLRISAAGPREARDPAASASSQPDTPGKAPVSRMFAMNDWALGGPKRYLDMRRSIDEKVATAEEDNKLPELIAGGKFMLAQGLPFEAMGFLQMAQNFMPLLRESAEFQAVRGAVYALAGQPEEALSAFATPGLETNDEINLWRMFATALQGKSLEAEKMLPKDNTIIGGYPARLQAMMLPTLIDVALGRGNIKIAEGMIDMYDAATDSHSYPDRELALAYFKGRLALLRGDQAGATEQFRIAAEGTFGPYPVRATLALVERGISAKTIERGDAIRKLERFRFAWRGDSLESHVLERLGLIYVTGGEQRRGLTILRDAATMAAAPEDREKLVAVMQKAFRELFSGKTREKMTPMESAAVAAEFAELMPAGGEGEAITMAIADQMVAVDLLDRAADMIEPMIEGTEKLQDALRYAERTAAIRIIDSRPADALSAIDKALSRPDAQATKAFAPADLKAFALLRAKAKSELKRPDEAMAELASIPEDADVLRLKGDIAWSAQNWPAAADAFGKLVKLANLDATRPPTREQAQLVLNQALALNLAGRSKELEALRVGYGDIMRRSELNQPFLLVTRTAREAKLADRTTLLKLVSEVNMFKDVLDTYKTTSKPTSAAPAQEKAEGGSGPAAGQDDQNPTEPGQQPQKSQ